MSSQILKSKGRNSKEFWRLANPKEEEEVNAFRKGIGNLTESSEEALKCAEDHFQALFSPKERPSQQENVEVPDLGRSKGLTKRFKCNEVVNCLKKLPKNKATGPDGIPNEALQTGAEQLGTSLLG